MDGLEGAGAYFRTKAVQWVRGDGSIAAHIRRVGQKGLVTEFRSDPGFDEVRRYLDRVSKVQYVQDTGCSDLRTRVQESVLRSSVRGRRVERQVDQIVRAALLACGISPFGQRLVRIAGALPRSGLTEPPSR